MSGSVGPVSGIGRLVQAEQADTSLSRTLQRASNGTAAGPSALCASVPTTAPAAREQLQRKCCGALLGAYTEPLMRLARGHDDRGLSAGRLLALATQVGLAQDAGLALPGEATELSSMALQLLDDQRGRVSFASYQNGHAAGYRLANRLEARLDQLIGEHGPALVAAADARLQPLLGQGLIQGVENRLGARLSEASAAQVGDIGHASTAANSHVQQQVARALGQANCRGLSDYIDAQLRQLDLYMADTRTDEHALNDAVPPGAAAGSTQSNTQTMGGQSVYVEAPGTREADGNMARALELLKDSLTQNRQLMERLLGVGNLQAPARTSQHDLRTLLPVPALKLQVSEHDGGVVEQTVFAPPPPVSVPAFAPVLVAPAPATLNPARYRIVMQNAPTLPPALLATDPGLGSLIAASAAVIQDSGPVDADVNLLKRALKLGWRPGHEHCPRRNGEATLTVEQLSRVSQLATDLFNRHAAVKLHFERLGGLIDRAGIEVIDWLGGQAMTRQIGGGAV